jgi:ribose/xylose/arabinose/galactoside ABC-type transport system permease subunit
MRAAVFNPNTGRWVLQHHAIWLVLLLLLAVAAMVSDAFLRPSYLLNTLRQAAPVGITAIGATMVMILRGVDLSVGAVISLAAVLCAVLMDGQAQNIPSAIALTCLAGAAIGLANGLLVAFNRISPFILTLGTAIIVYGVMQIQSGGTARGIVAPGFREFLNGRIGGVFPVLSLALILLAALGIWMQSATRFGRSLYLIGSSPAAAELSGVPIRRVTVLAYTLSGLFAALGGIALLARTGVSSTYAGRGYEFDVLAAVVLGGTTFAGGRGGVGGTIAGVLMLFVAFNLVSLAGLPFSAQLVVKGAIIITASAAYEAIKR